MIRLQCHVKRADALQQRFRLRQHTHQWGAADENVASQGSGSGSGPIDASAVADDDIDPAELEDLQQKFTDEIKMLQSLRTTYEEMLAKDRLS